MAGVVYSLTPWGSPPIALAVGLALALSIGNPFDRRSKRAAKILLQLSVIGLGFGLNLVQVIRAGKSGFAYTAIGLTGTLLVGWMLGRMLGIGGKLASLISVGTAICGGSAIAAVAPVLEAEDEEIAVSMGTVFILNAVGLFVFPLLGHAMGMNQTQFGLWAALAIHDTSSVVGAAAKYGAVALALATTVKLARALWIIPVTAVTAAVSARRLHIHVPWFIFFFVAAAAANTYGAVHFGTEFHWLSDAAKVGLTLTLFLIGASVSRATLRQVGARPLVQGILLWVFAAVTSLLMVRGHLFGA